MSDSPVKRYDLETVGRPYMEHGAMVEQDALSILGGGGEWMRYEDHLALAAKLAAMEEALRHPDIDLDKLLAALRALSDAFVKGQQGSYGMRIPAEPYRDGDLVCGAAFRLLSRIRAALGTIGDGALSQKKETSS